MKNERNSERRKNSDETIDGMSVDRTGEHNFECEMRMATKARKIDRRVSKMKKLLTPSPSLSLTSRTRTTRMTKMPKIGNSSPARDH